VPSLNFHHGESAALFGFHFQVHLRAGTPHLVARSLCDYSSIRMFEPIVSLGKRLP
jgi:hypothetical protein